MWMSEGEIVRKFVRNGKMRSQISILAELNGETKDTIAEILIRNEVLDPQDYKMSKKESDITDEFRAQIIEMYKTMSAPQISRETGVSLNEVKKIVKCISKRKPRSRKIKSFTQQVQETLPKKIF